MQTGTKLAALRAIRSTSLASSVRIADRRGLAFFCTATSGIVASDLATSQSSTQILVILKFSSPNLAPAVHLSTSTQGIAAAPCLETAPSEFTCPLTASGALPEGVISFTAAETLSGQTANFTLAVSHRLFPVNDTGRVSRSAVLSVAKQLFSASLVLPKHCSLLKTSVFAPSFEVACLAYQYSSFQGPVNTSVPLVYNSGIAGPSGVLVILTTEDCLVDSRTEVETDGFRNAYFSVVCDTTGLFNLNFTQPAVGRTDILTLQVYELAVSYVAAEALVNYEFNVTVTAFSGDTYLPGWILLLGTSDPACRVLNSYAFTGFFGDAIFTVLCTAVGPHTFQAANTFTRSWAASAVVSVYELTFQYDPEQAMSQQWFPATVHADDGAPVPGMKLNVTFGEFSWVVETDAEGDAAFLVVAPSRSRCTVFNVLAPTYTVWVDIDVYSLYVDYDSGLALVATPFMVTVSSTVRSDDALQLATTESSCSITPVNPFMDVFGYTYFSVLCTSAVRSAIPQRSGSSLSTSPVSLYVYSMSFYYYPKLAYTNHEFTIYVMINNVHQPRSLVMYLGTKERSCTVLTMTSGFGAGTGTFSVMCTSAGDFVFEASIDPTFETKYEGVVSVTGSGVKELLSNTHASL